MVMTSRPAGLTVTGLTVDVPGRRVVHGIDLAVPRGRVLALVGPSGSGKTLTARAIAGLGPHGGTVLVDGRPPVRGRDVGYAFQDALASLNPTITVRRHLTETVKVHRRGDPYTALARFDLDPALAAASPPDFAAAPAGEGGEKLSARGVRRVLRSRRRTALALDDVDLDIGAGEAVAVVGRSGSGKTTLLGALAALDRPDKGTVLRNGDDVWTLRERRRRAVRRRTALIFQDPLASFDPRHTVRQVIAEAGPYDDDLLRYVGLDPAMAGRRPATLSGGERQRVAIARALAQEPTVLLADEPTSGLDVLTRERILRLLADLRRDHGHTIVLVTHDLHVARRVADRVVVLDGGRIAEDLPAADLDDARHPATRRLLEASAHDLA